MFNDFDLVGRMTLTTILCSVSAVPLSSGNGKYLVRINPQINTLVRSLTWNIA